MLVGLVSRLLLSNVSMDLVTVRSQEGFHLLMLGVLHLKLVHSSILLFVSLFELLDTVVQSRVALLENVHSFLQDVDLVLLIVDLSLKLA